MTPNPLLTPQRQPEDVDAALQTATHEQFIMNSPP